MDKQTNLNKCLRIYASWRSLKWEKLESNQMNEAVLYTQSWVVSLQTNTLSTLYIYIRAFYSWTLQSAFQKISLCLPGKAAPCGVKASSVRQLAQQCREGKNPPSEGNQCRVNLSRMLKLVVLLLPPWAVHHSADSHWWMVCYQCRNLPSRRYVVCEWLLSCK